MPNTRKLNKLLKDVRACRICHNDLPMGANPVSRLATSSKLMIVGQAPGIRVHESSIPWNDPSGDRLREWLGIGRELFYDEKQIAILPMGLCYPGTGKSGDLPPRKECAPAWFDALWQELPNIKLTLVIGQYAQKYYLGKDTKKNLSETVKAWQDYLPEYLPLPHPSPRNNIWLKKNPWFEQKVIPTLRKKVAEIL